VRKESKGRITRKEEALEVGLARHEKSQTRWPWWAIEYGAWIVMAVVVVGVIIPFGFLGWRLTHDRPVASAASAKLVVVFGPARVWAEGSTARVQSLSVKVANQGGGVATNVRVSALIGGDGFALGGAGSIEAGKVESFNGDINRNVPEGETIRILMTCDSCQ
jgi:hypothetical protein